MKHLRALFAFAILATSPIWTPLALGQSNPLTISPSTVSLSGTAGSTSLVRGTIRVTSSTSRRITVSALRSERKHGLALCLTLGNAEHASVSDGDRQRIQPHRGHVQRYHQHSLR